VVEGEDELMEAEEDTTRKHDTFLANVIKMYPIWIGVKKTTSSFWAS
jgi:hypothetical protein